MTEEEKRALREEAAELVNGAARSPFAALGVDPELLEALLEVMRDLVSIALIEGYERGLAAGARRARPNGEAER
jgi:molybdopterin-guanine dinucleotide biosynthesis protein